MTTKTASDIQKERIQEIEEKAARLLEKCDVVTLYSSLSLLPAGFIL